MSRLLGEGIDAVLVARGAESPEADSRRRAVASLLKGCWLHGNPGGRDWNGCVYDAIEALCPEAARCLDEEGAHAAWEKFGESVEEEST